MVVRLGVRRVFVARCRAKTSQLPVRSYAKQGHLRCQVGHRAPHICHHSRVRPTGDDDDRFVTADWDYNLLNEQFSGVLCLDGNSIRSASHEHQDRTIRGHG
jgi:hypothetical protein